VREFLGMQNIRADWIEMRVSRMMGRGTGREPDMSDFSFAANRASKLADNALRFCCCAEMLRSRALISFCTRAISASTLDDAPGSIICRLMPAVLPLGVRSAANQSSRATMLKASSTAFCPSELCCKQRHQVLGANSYAVLNQTK